MGAKVARSRDAETSHFSVAREPRASATQIPINNSLSANKYDLVARSPAAALVKLR